MVSHTLRKHKVDQEKHGNNIDARTESQVPKVRREEGIILKGLMVIFS